MDDTLEHLLVDLLRTQRVTALATLRDGAPSVSMTPYAVSPDLACFFVHISRLAYHTQDILRDPRVGLLIAQPDTGAGDPQALARVTILGQANELSPSSHESAAARALYLERFPSSVSRFAMSDFLLFQICVRSARFVAGFGKILDLAPDQFRRAAETWPA